MTDRVLSITDRFITYQHKLRLDDWDIRYADDWNDDNVDTATIHHHAGTKTATVRIHPAVRGVNLDAHVVHELMHLVTSDYAYSAKNAIAKLGPGAEAVLDILGEMEERICDTVAHALTGVTYIPVAGNSVEFHVPFLDTTTCTE